MFEEKLADYDIGIDLGSSATKVAVVRDGEIHEVFLCPTGYSSIEAAERVHDMLEEKGYLVQSSRCVATGYGRVAVPYADKLVTEITCHAKGAHYLFESDGTVIDVGGQDTKIITLEKGKVSSFVMNDKCSAGTGKFLEIMANRLNVSQADLSELAQKGSPTAISSLCTVFAETEVISLIGQGTPRENIAYAVIESVVSKVCAMTSRKSNEQVFLTGGLCDNGYLVERLSVQMKQSVQTETRARYAGAIGAALCAQELRC
ncbi:MAG: acyl-CoA dehydratase activase [Raoultibacter sp.]|jgi:predicted CoA-substrate-specific enzyme activase